MISCQASWERDRERFGALGRQNAPLSSPCRSLAAVACAVTLIYLAHLAHRCRPHTISLAHGHAGKRHPTSQRAGGISPSSLQENFSFSFNQDWNSFTLFFFFFWRWKSGDKVTMEGSRPEAAGDWPDKSGGVHPEGFTMSCHREISAGTTPDHKSWVTKLVFLPRLAKRTPDLKPYTITPPPCSGVSR